MGKGVPQAHGVMMAPYVLAAARNGISDAVVVRDATPEAAVGLRHGCLELASR